jgi:hypothetical protein
MPALGLEKDTEGYSHGTLLHQKHFKLPMIQSRVLRLRIVVKLKNRDPRATDMSQHKMFTGVHNLLYCISSKLSVEGRVKMLEVEVDATAFPTFQTVYKEVLWPLTKFPALTTLSVSGISPEVCANLRAQAALRERPEFDVQKRSQQVMSKAEREISVLQGLGFYGNAMFIEENMVPFKALLDKDSYMDDDRETCLTRTWESLIDALDDNVDELVLGPAQDKIDELMNFSYRIDIGE